MINTSYRLQNPDLFDTNKFLPHVNIPDGLIQGRGEGAYGSGETLPVSDTGRDDVIRIDGDFVPTTPPTPEELYYG